MRLAALPLLFAPLLLSPLAQAAALSVCTEASPEGFDVVQYNSLTTTNASADVLMNRLVDFDASSGTLQPSLAKTWEVSADGLSYSFTLRTDVQFHQTDYFSPSRLLNADDVLFSFQRMLDPVHPWHKVAPSGYPHAQSMQLPSLIKSIDKTGEHSLRFNLNRPDATFLATLSMGFASIYSAEYAEQLLAAGTPEALNSQPIGTGPFIFKRFQKDASVRYSANPSYFGGKPAVDNLIFAITPDANVRLQKLRRGECQIALSPKPLDVQAVAGEQHLCHCVVVLVEQLVIGVHQLALPHGGAGLLGGHITGAGGQGQLAHSHADGTGRDENDLVPCVIQVAQHLDQILCVADVQPPGGVCQRGGAHFDDDAHKLNPFPFPLSYCTRRSRHPSPHRAGRALPARARPEWCCRRGCTQHP